MANLAFTVDPDPHRRRRFLQAARQRVAPVSGLEIRSAEIGNLVAVWAISPTAPKSCCQDTHGFSLLLGYAIDDNGRRQDAQGLLAQRANGDSTLSTFDGYYVAVAYQPTRGLVVQGDPLGLFPLYYNQQNDFLVVGSSPELCAAHPCLPVSLDILGLAGILLTNGLVGNCPLMAGIKRLAAGHGLAATSPSAVREVETYRLSREEHRRHGSFAEACQHVDHEIRQAIERHRPPNVRTSLMLSGGLDSRLMAGYLSEEGVPYTPLTLGRKSDFEVRAAAEVATALGHSLECHSREPDEAEFVHAARMTARCEHLTGGFGNQEMWMAGEHLANTAPCFWSGFGMDEVLGGFAAGAGYNPKTNTWSFEFFLRLLNRWGLDLATLKQLFRISDGNAMLEELVSVLRRDYEQGELSGPQRGFRAKLGSRVRFHIGAVLHRLSFRSWPLLPILDRRLLQIFFNLDAEVLLNRRLESELLQSRYPRLASIPFDTNSFRFSASHVKSGRVTASWPVRVADWLTYRARRWYWQRWRRAEPRRYVRLFDLNTPNWQAVRIAAEPYRSSLHRWLDPNTLDQLLPPPHVKIRYRDPFGEGSPRRALLGLMLWNAEENTYRGDESSSGRVNDTHRLGVKTEFDGPHALTEGLEKI